MSFRGKMLAAMMLVVAGISAATLFVTRQGVESAYQATFRERFESEVDAFLRLRETRLQAVRARCLELARSVRLIAAFDEGEPGLLYRIALDELREVLQPPEPDDLTPRATFFRFVDAGGRVVPPPDDRAGLVGGEGTPLWEREIAAAGDARSESQRVGYVAPTIDGRPRLHEVVATPIVDPVTGRSLGTLAIGFPAAEPGPGETRGRIRSGIWLDGRLHSPGLPETLEPELAAYFQPGEDEPSESPVLEVDGIPHRLFVRPLNPGSRFPEAWLVGLYPMDEAIARQESLRLRLLVAAAAALVVGLGLSAVLAQGLSVPIRELVSATTEVQRGNLDVRVPVRREDEIGRLAASFNEMTEDLALKERYRSLLNLVADREVAQQMVEGRVALGGELREVSVLFCDIRGFTAFSAEMAPAEVVHLLNEHMTALTRVVYDHEGVVDKFVGDSLMALFGAPKTSGRDAAHAVSAAWRMLEERRRLNATSSHRVEIGIGIASGLVVAGCMGSADRQNYTVLGDRVNLAARLCAEAPPMEVLIDEATRERAGGLARVEALPELRLKGFRAPVAAFRVVEVLPLEIAS